MDNKTILEQAQAKIEEEKNNSRIKLAKDFLEKKVRFQKEVDDYTKRMAKIDKVLTLIGTDREDEIDEFDF